MDFFCADPHFTHKRVIKKEGRPYRSIKRMDNDLTNKWNTKLKEHDTVYMLGDFCQGGEERIKEILSILKGHKKILRGNHDYGISHKKWLEYGFEESLLMGKSKTTYYVYERDGIQVALSHYPIENCPYFNIHGHVHARGGDLDKTKHLCVSMECINYTPISWEDIKEEMRRRKVI